ncbi:MAG TPA: HRDC domain-containing protein [Gammaproteobacteria bacterium]|nr:HRDC domain-containing protein [Gammaproteobacteria bacterium]
MQTETLIADGGALEALVASISTAPLVAIDTEFVRERTYFPQLCLVQAATSERAACVDCLASLDFAALFGELAAPEHTWVLHSARQDLEVVRHHAGASPARIIDTQVAAALLGRAPQVSLQDLLGDVLGVALGKGFTRTDWSARPLPEGAVRYAIDDVAHLLPLWERLERSLIELGRLEWLHEDCRRLIEDTAGGDRLVIFRRLKGVQGLDRDSQAAALALVEWREATARKLDRPRRWIMSDDLLVRIVQQKPGTHARLEGIADMPRRLAARYGEEILAAVEARRRPDLEAVVEAEAAGEPPDKQRFKELQHRVRERAAELGIEPEVLATRRDLGALLRGRPPAHLEKGWRAAEIEPLL